MSMVCRLNQDLIQETDRIWMDEPYEITLIKNGLILSGAGSNGQYYSVLVHLEGFMMFLGPHVIYRLLLLTKDPEISLYALREVTLTVLSRPFDQFKLLGDLGLPSARTLGSRYLEAVEAIETREDFVELTGNLLSYVNRLYQWIHFIFPWSIGSSFPKREPSEVALQLDAIERWTNDNGALTAG